MKCLITISLQTIPTPEVFETKDYEIITADLYKKSYKPPKQYIHVQPFAVDRDQPDYNLDDEDAEFLEQKLNGEKNFEVVELVFEEMIDTLEKNSGHSVISAREAKQLLKEDDDLILAVYDYWVDKRLRLRKPLIPMVKTDKREVVAPAPGSSGTHDPYMAFRRRTEKMQTRKNRKNDEVSYEKMLKLRRDLSRDAIRISFRVFIVPGKFNWGYYSVVINYLMLGLLLFPLFQAEMLRLRKM